MRREAEEALAAWQRVQAIKREVEEALVKFRAARKRGEPETPGELETPEARALFSQFIAYMDAVDEYKARHPAHPAVVLGPGGPIREGEEGCLDCGALTDNARERPLRHRPDCPSGPSGRPSLDRDVEADWRDYASRTAVRLVDGQGETVRVIPLSSMPRWPRGTPYAVAWGGRHWRTTAAVPTGVVEGADHRFANEIVCDEVTSADPLRDYERDEPPFVLPELA